MRTSVRIRNDLLLILPLLLLAAAAAAIVIFTARGGRTVTVIVDGQERGSYALAEDLRLPIVTKNGENLLVIKDGTAFIEEADCPDLICKHHKPVSREGETITCIPNRVVVRIDG